MFKYVLSAPEKMIDWLQWVATFQSMMNQAPDGERERMLWRSAQELLRKEGETYDAMVALRKQKTMTLLAEEDDVSIHQKVWAALVAGISDFCEDMGHGLAARIRNVYPEAFPPQILVFDDTTRRLTAEFDLSAFYEDPLLCFQVPPSIARPIVHYLISVQDEGMAFGMPYDDLRKHVPDACDVSLLFNGPFYNARYNARTRQSVTLFMPFRIDYNEGSDYALMPTRSLLERVFLLKETACLRVVK